MDILSLVYEVSTVNSLHDRARFQVSVVATNVTVFWNATIFSLIENYSSIEIWK